MDYIAYDFLFASVVTMVIFCIVSEIKGGIDHQNS